MGNCCESEIVIKDYTQAEFIKKIKPGSDRNSEPTRFYKESIEPTLIISVLEDIEVEEKKTSEKKTVISGPGITQSINLSEYQS